jgi:hypothetical protein
MDKNKRRALAELVNDLTEALHASNEELTKFFRQATCLVERYAFASELPGEICLVLDNSYIQDFKHAEGWRTEVHAGIREKKRARALRATAFLALCRFVTDWSHRQTDLGVSPVAIYEHMGRPTAESRRDVERALAEIVRVTRPCALDVAVIGFRSFGQLLHLLPLIRADEQYLRALTKKLDEENWRRDLSDGIGTRIPSGIARDAIPDDMPLQYFDPWYAGYVYRHRVERRIIEQSTHEPHAARLSTGRHGEIFARLCGIGRRGRFVGLGDLELLQICDILRQQQCQAPKVMFGQTVDRGLTEVLSLRTALRAGATVVGGSRDQQKQIDTLVRTMTTNPVAEYQARGAPMHYKAKEFRTVLFDLVAAVQRGRPPLGRLSVD